MDRQTDGEWRTSQLLISNLKKCKSATYSIKQEVQKVHNTPERACTYECLNVSLFVAERVRNNFYQKGFLSQKVKDLSFKPGLELYSPDLPPTSSSAQHIHPRGCPRPHLFSLFPYSSPVSGAWLVGGDSEWKDWPHPRELRGVPLTSSPSGAAELYVVSMTTLLLVLWATFHCH